MIHSSNLSLKNLRISLVSILYKFFLMNKSLSLNFFFLSTTGNSGLSTTPFSFNKFSTSTDIGFTSGGIVFSTLGLSLLDLDAALKLFRASTLDLCFLVLSVTPSCFVSVID